MKKTAAFVLMLPAMVLASASPVSGVFSNVTKGSPADEPEYQFNLIVTVNNSGQQFFLQCFENGTPGFGVSTQLESPKSKATINAGPECPANKLQIELDYEEATIRFAKARVILPRGNIHVPIVD